MAGQTETLQEYVARLVDAAPPLNPAQRDRLRVLLGGRAELESQPVPAEDRLAAYLKGDSA